MNTSDYNTTQLRITICYIIILVTTVWINIEYNKIFYESRDMIKVNDRSEAGGGSVYGNDTRFPSSIFPSTGTIVTRRG